jgi:hypothetical protein
MMRRVLSLTAALAVVLFVGAAVAADKTDKDKDNTGSTVTGTVSKVSSDSITVTDSNGKDHMLTIAKDAKITCDGKDCKLADLDPSKVKSVTVTLNTDDKTKADKIEAKTSK